jgi:hypothetical protein
MIIIRKSDGSQYYAATKKLVPGLIQTIRGNEKLESLIDGSEYFEFVITERKTGALSPFKPLSDLLAVTCALVPRDSLEEEEEEELDNE